MKESIALERSIDHMRFTLLASFLLATIAGCHGPATAPPATPTRTGTAAVQLSAADELAPAIPAHASALVDIASLPLLPSGHTKTRRGPGTFHVGMFSDELSWNAYRSAAGLTNAPAIDWSRQRMAFVVLDARTHSLEFRSLVGNGRTARVVVDWHMIEIAYENVTPGVFVAIDRAAFDQVDARSTEGAVLASAAQRAYERIAGGDLAGATSDYAAALRELDAEGLVDDHPTLRGALGLLRLEAESAQRRHPDRPPEVDCAVFEKHGADALHAYAAWFASTRDLYGYAIKTRCLGATLAAAAPIDAARALAAKDQLVSALTAEIPIPEGTMYQGMAVGAADAVVDSLLAPEAIESLDGDADLHATAKQTPSAASAVTRFVSVREAAVPMLATGVCSVLRARGHRTDPSRCEKIARSAASNAMSRWIKATRDAS